MDKSNDYYTITRYTCPTSKGTAHDYYSNGTYWWPNENTKDGLPFVRRDGFVYPGAFHAHKNLLLSFSKRISDLTITALEAESRMLAKKIEGMLRVFFLDEKTRMNPDFRYSQAIPGICDGRGIGIIDGLQLIDVAISIRALRRHSMISETTHDELCLWFSSLLSWLTESEAGKTESMEKNNHSITFYVQVASYALLLEDKAKLMEYAEIYKTRLFDQIASDGSFPLELARTKPYSYSIFALDNMVTLCQILSKQDKKLFFYETRDKVSLKTAIDFLFPYLKDKTLWPYAKDCECFEFFPNKISLLAFASMAYNEEKYMMLYDMLPDNSSINEVARNRAVKNYRLYLD